MPLAENAPQQDARRIPVVDLVRLLSIALVLGVHFSSAKQGIPFPDGWQRDLWRLFVRNGVYGVSVFFVVSGYVISRSMAEHEPDLSNIRLRDFYAKRAARILPLFFLTVAVGAVGLWTLPPDMPGVASWLKSPGALFDGPFWASLFTFSFNWLRISRDHTPGAAFGLHWDVLWSLAVEEQFYLFYPLMLRTLKTRANVLLGVLLVVAMGPVARAFYIQQDPNSFLLTFTSSLVCFDLLAMGALLFFILERLPAARAAWEPALGIAAFGVMAAVHCFTFLGDASQRHWAPSLLGLGAAVFMGVGVRANWFNSPLARALVKPGQLSYGAYLFHPLVLGVLWQTLGTLPYALGFPLFCVATFVVAQGLFAGVEKPARRLVLRWLGVAQQRQEPPVSG